MSRESDIQTDIIAYLRGRGCYVANIGGSASSAKGTADLLVCHEGWFIALELKKPDGSYGETKPQEIRGRQVRKAGGAYAIVASIAEAATALLKTEEAL